MPRVITAHGGKRVRKRVGIKKKSVTKNSDTAFSQGVAHTDSTGRLKKYFDYLYLSHGIANNIRMHGGYVYLFSGSTLITVFPIPNAYRDAVIKIQKRLKQRLESIS